MSFKVFFKKQLTYKVPVVRKLLAESSNASTPDWCVEPVRVCSALPFRRRRRRRFRCMMTRRRRASTADQLYSQFSCRVRKRFPEWDSNPNRRCCCCRHTDDDIHCWCYCCCCWIDSLRLWMWTRNWFDSWIEDRSKARWSSSKWIQFNVFNSTKVDYRIFSIITQTVEYLLLRFAPSINIVGRRATIRAVYCLKFRSSQLGGHQICRNRLLMRMMMMLMRTV